MKAGSWASVSPFQMCVTFAWAQDSVGWAGLLREFVDQSVHNRLLDLSMQEPPKGIQPILGP